MKIVPGCLESAASFPELLVTLNTRALWLAGCTGALLSSSHAGSSAKVLALLCPASDYVYCFPYTLALCHSCSHFHYIRALNHSFVKGAEYRMDLNPQVMLVIHN